MTKLRFALVLLLSIGVSADNPVGNVGSYYPPSGTNPQNVYPGSIQQSNESPPTIVQQPVAEQPQFVQQMSYNSEDYDGEQYEDNRLRLMLYPKKPIALNETNLRTWKANPVTQPNWNQYGATEANVPVLAVRRSAFTEDEMRNAETEESAKNIQLSVSISGSTGKAPVNAEQIIGDTLTNLTSQTGGGQASGIAAISVQNDGNSNGSAQIVTSDKGLAIALSGSGNLSQINPFQQTSQMIGNEPKVTGLNDVPSTDGKIISVTIPNKTDEEESTTEPGYVDIENDSDYDDEDDADDVPDTNSYVIVLPGTGPTNITISKNISSLQPEIISDSLLYMLSNLTSTSAMIERNERRILKELREHKAQISDVNHNITNIYELLKKITDNK